MPSIDVSDLSFSYSTQPLLSNLSFTVEDGERAVFVGPNGSGKSTLLRIISGDLKPDHGTATICGVLANRPLHVLSPQDCEGSVQDYLDRVLAAPRNLLTRLEELTVQMAHANQSVYLAEEYDRVLACLAAGDVWSLDARVDEVLAGVGLTQFTEDGKTRPLATLSPGQAGRLKLAGLMLVRPAVLILDEPTNHLDDQAVAYLVKQIEGWSGPVVMASHDRAFIEQTATVIFDLDTASWQAVATAEGGGQLHGVYRSHGSYSDYLLGKEHARAEHHRLHGAQQREKCAVQLHRRRSENIAQGGVKLAEAAGKARKFYSDRAAKTALRRTRNDDQRLEDLAEREVRKPRFYELEIELSRIIPRLGLSVAVRNASVLGRLEETTFDLSAGEHLLVTGVNGAGKTTLLRWIVSGEPPHDVIDRSGGTVTVDGRLAIVPQCLPRKGDSYFTEEYWERGIGELGSGVLHPSMWSTPIARLSDGNQRRVQIALAIAQKPEILVIDEPTNYLDLNTIEKLETALNLWNGTLIIASHDRWLIEHWHGRHLSLDPVAAIPKP